MPALFHVAYRIAREQPAEAERLAAEALDFAPRSCRQVLSKTIQPRANRGRTGDLGQWERDSAHPALLRFGFGRCRSGGAGGGDNPEPSFTGVCRGNAGESPRADGQTRARKLILRAYDGLADACRNPDRRWPRDSWRFSPPIVAAGLLPVVERIDPTLVGEFLWRALSYRLPRSADDCLVSLEPERNDATLAAFAARYDRGLARALLPPVDKTIVPAPAWADDSYWIPMFAMTDVNEALEKLRAGAASPDADAGQCLQNAFFLMQMLPIDGSHRWDFYAMNNCGLWNPDNQYYGVGSYAW